MPELPAIVHHIIEEEPVAQLAILQQVLRCLLVLTVHSYRTVVAGCLCRGSMDGLVLRHHSIALFCRKQN